jgi:hypothetical protein
MTTAHSVSLAKPADETAGLPLSRQVENLRERLFEVARELDVAKAELAAQGDVEVAWIKVAFGLLAENELLRRELAQARRP